MATTVQVHGGMIGNRGKICGVVERVPGEAEVPGWGELFRLLLLACLHDAMETTEKSTSVSLGHLRNRINHWRAESDYPTEVRKRAEQCVRVFADRCGPLARAAVISWWDSLPIAYR